MTRWSCTRAAAAVELALLAPIPIMLMIAAVDTGLALLSHAQIARALASSAQYATLAGQNNVAFTTISVNAKTLASAVASGFLGTPVVTAVVNNAAAVGALCCPGLSWTCSSAGGFTCADGSTPGSYLTITARYPFTPLWSPDTLLVGKILTEAVVVPLK